MSFTALSVHTRHNRLSVALNFLKKFLLRKAITCCAGKQLNMPKHTSITSCHLVSNAFLNELLIHNRSNYIATCVTDKPPSQVEELVQSQEGAPQTHSAHRQIARQLGVSVASVNRIVEKDLQLQCLRRRRAHELTESFKQEDKTELLPQAAGTIQH